MFRKLNAILAFLILIQVLIQNIEGQQQPENRTLEENLDAYTDRLNRTKRYARIETMGKPWKGWNKKYITYKITKYTKQLSKKAVDRIMKKAFKLWQKPSKLIFKQKTSGYIDIHIKFLKFGLPKDFFPYYVGKASTGKNEKLSSMLKGNTWFFGTHFMDYINHGTIIFNDDVKWKDTVDVNSIPGGYPVSTSLPWLAAHEIGHVLGLDDSRVYGAVMFQGSLPERKKFSLHRDDIKGIRAIMKGMKTNVFFSKCIDNNFCHLQ